MCSGGGLQGFFTTKPGDPGRTAADNRLFVNSVLWVLRSGAHLHDLPERYGKWKTRPHALRALGHPRSVGARVRGSDYGPQERISHARYPLVRAHQQAAIGTYGPPRRQVAF
jgi:transposase